MGVKLAATHWPEFSNASHGHSFQAHSYVSGGYLRKSPAPEVLETNLCPPHSSGSAFPPYKSWVRVSTEAQLPAAQSPGDPRTHQLSVSPWLWRLPGLQLGPDSKVFVLWTVLGQSLSWRGNVTQRLLSQIRFNESRGCVIKGSSQEVGLELFENHSQGFLPSHLSEKIKHIKKERAAIWWRLWRQIHWVWGWRAGAMEEEKGWRGDKSNS